MDHSALAGCGGAIPFRYVKVSGKVTYRGRLLIPVESLTLTFFPECGPLIRNLSAPRLTLVDKMTARSVLVTTTRPATAWLRGQTQSDASHVK